MKKKIVTKISYTFFNVIFHCLCMSGLIWQLTMISISYFSYDVVADIKIIMPENDNYERYLNFCYWGATVINYSKYENLLKLYRKDMSLRDVKSYKHDFIVYNITLQEQFDVSASERIVDEKHNSTTFLYGDYTCRQIKSTNHRYLVKANQFNQNVSYIFLMVSRRLPKIDTNRFLGLTHEINVSSYVVLSPFSFYGHKLKSPYADRCIDFNAFNFTGYNEAISSCIDKSMVSQPRIVPEYEQRLMKYFRSKIDLFSICEKYMRTECHSHTIFTQLVSRSQQKKKGNETVFVYHMSMRHAHQPSFRIASKAKIEDVDLITYILGALGSWIGFSFLGFNPVPFFLKTDDGAAEWVSKVGLTKDDIRMIKHKITCLEHEKERNRIEREREKARWERDKKEIKSMRDEIRLIRSKFD